MDWNSRRITAIIENALLEDRATRDATSYACIDPQQRATGTILVKQDCVLAGLGLVPRIFDVYAALDGAVSSHYEITSHPEVFDGIRMRSGQTAAVIRHNARVILSCERVILNFMQRLSGIATLTRKFVEAISGTKAKILDTRKTVPGLRMLDKYAVRCGGRAKPPARPFRWRADQEQSHCAGGGIVPVLDRALRNRRGEQLIEVEVRSPRELEEALTHGAESILLDNMSVVDVKSAVERCSRLERRSPLECSGGITLENVRAYAETGVDFISVGALTHSPLAGRSEFESNSGISSAQRTQRPQRTRAGT